MDISIIQVENIKFYLILIILIFFSIQDILFREVSNIASFLIFIIALYRVNLINLIAIIIAPLPLILSNIKEKNSFGGADIKIMMTLGVYLGSLKSIYLLCISLFIELIIKKITKKETQPFIPYILISYVLVKVFSI